MKLPANDRLHIDAAKVRDYLLGDAHPIGRFKAIFFRALGYSRADWQRLEADLRRLGATRDAVPGERTAYGQKYEVRGTLRGPSGRAARVVTVWIVRTGDEIPRFITAFPGERR